MEIIKLPESVQYILSRLNKNNYEAYVVGGCVRDSLMKRIPHDWDICTSALPEQVMEIFNEHQIIPTGLKHGTVTIVIDKEPFEVTTYRIDGEYEDNRHPKNVVYTKSLHEDLMRRDFTINALAYNPTEGIIDIVDGIKDIKNKTIRCVGNSGERFREDALRMLRAIRFAARYSFRIHHKTIFSILANKELLKNISIERISSEILKTLSSNYVNSRIYYLLATCVKQIIPELDNTNVVNISYKVERSPADIYVRLALLLNFDEEKLPEVLKRLRFDNDTIKKVCNVSKFGKYICFEVAAPFNKEIHQECFYKYLARILIKELGNKMAISSIHFAALLQEYKYNDIIRLIDFVNTEIENNSCCSIAQMQIDGNDLVNIGFCGIEVGKCLNTLLEEIMQDKLENNRECLLKRAEELRNL